jgi:hypothetical protein
LAVITLGLTLSGIDQQKTTRAELRGYLSMTPKIFSNFGTTTIINIEFISKNHGQTPAFNNSHAFRIDVLPNPLPPNFVFSSPTNIINPNNTIFPGDDAKVWFNHARLLTVREVAAVSANTNRIWIWGITTYRDAFRKIRTTKFCASAGGQNFAVAQLRFQSGLPVTVGWNWEYGNEHNQAT